jgi:hypothetical protein
MEGRIINNDVSVHGAALGTGDFFGVSHLLLGQGTHVQPAVSDTSEPAHANALARRTHDAGTLVIN